MTVHALPNGRDLGGRTGAGGARIRTGLVFRSAAPTDEAAAQALLDLDVRTVFDLRTTPEREAQPDDLPTEVRGIVADMLADAPGSGAASLGRLAADAFAGRSVSLDADDVDAMMLESYRSFVTLDSAKNATADFLRHLVEPGPGAVLFHCTAGKDRTGWLAALTLTALDVEEDEVMADYLASGAMVEQMMAPLAEAAAARGLDLSALRPAMIVDPKYLRAAFDTLAQTYGTLADYLGTGLGLPADYREQLYARLLT